MRYGVLGPGKRLRPALTMACCAACGTAPEQALDAGCAVEFVHCFSLIHDDLPAIDNDDLRRGRKTCHVVYGEPMAILAGDALFALAFETLARTPCGAAGVLELAQSVGYGGVVGGEALDILSENAEHDAGTLTRIHREKTGALFSAACALGGMCAGASHERIVELRDYGMSLGLAFQIADDILNETSTSEQLGKAAGSDAAMRKLTYPAVYGLEHSRELASRAVHSALKALDNLPDDTDWLRSLAWFTIERSK